MNYQENLRYLRLHGKKVNPLASGHLSKARMELYESGRVSPPLDQLEEIANYYGESLHDVLFEDLWERKRRHLAKAIEEPIPIEHMADEQLLRIHQLQQQRIILLENMIRRHLPALAKDLGTY